MNNNYLTNLELFAIFHLPSLEHDRLSKCHGTADIFCNYAQKHDTVHMSTWVNSLSNMRPPSTFPVLDSYSSLHPSHSLFLTSLVDLWPVTMLDQATTLAPWDPFTMTLTQEPQMHVSKCQGHTPNYNMGEYIWSNQCLAHHIL